MVHQRQYEYSLVEQHISSFDSDHCGYISYPPHFDGSHVNDLLRSDLRLSVGYGLILKISCDVSREDLSIPCTGFGYPFYDSLKSLAEVYCGNELRVFIWRIINMSRHTRIVHNGNLTFIYISGTIRISCDRRINYMQRSRLVWFNLIICGRHNL